MLRSLTMIYQVGLMLLDIMWITINQSGNITSLIAISAKGVFFLNQALKIKSPFYSLGHSKLSSYHSISLSIFDGYSSI